MASQQAQQSYNFAPNWAAPQQYTQNGQALYQPIPASVRIPVPNQVVSEYQDRILIVRTHSDGSVELLFPEENQPSGSPIRRPEEDEHAKPGFWQGVDWASLFTTAAEKVAEKGTDAIFAAGVAGAKKVLIKGSTVRPPQRGAATGQDYHQGTRYQSSTNIGQQNRGYVGSNVPEGQRVMYSGGGRPRSRSHPGPAPPRETSTQPPSTYVPPVKLVSPGTLMVGQQADTRFERSSNQNTFISGPPYNQRTGLEYTPAQQGYRGAGQQQYNQNTIVVPQVDKVRGRQPYNQFDLIPGGRGQQYHQFGTATGQGHLGTLSTSTAAAKGAVKPKSRVSSPAGHAASRTGIRTHDLQTHDPPPKPRRHPAGRKVGSKNRRNVPVRVAVRRH